MGAAGTTAATPTTPTGRPNNDHRQVVEAMAWPARTGAPWRDLPAQDGSHHLAMTLADRPGRQTGMVQRSRRGAPGPRATLYDPRRTPGSSRGVTAATSPAAMVQPKA
jgi:hypothetical protein